VQSSIVIDDLDANTLKVLFEKCFNGEGDTPMTPKLLQAIYAQLAQGILAKQGEEGKMDPPTKEQLQELENWYENEAKEEAKREAEEKAKSEKGGASSEATTAPA